ncbi:MAG: dihydroorotate dehydrogenase-like protein [Bacteroidaceae bacterium]|nr:dihydroorotate dehydrogenase-like protein [Bacteroidaceae bacterium]MBQ8008733.1 dihydroorotate dehydrogenase-like protein [Bacteroidaceae bacterium]MBR1541970.1 dihydroorotate dehydrogenase-like protein [Bacteroidaceae bacterium]
MRTLETTFAGLSLKNPVIVSSSSLTDNAEKNKQLCEAGAGAVVLKSLFEEQILQEVEGMEDFDPFVMGGNDLTEYFRHHKLEEYFALIRDTKRMVDIPVIASINAYDEGNWTEFAQKIEAAGADALEINILALQTSLDYQYGAFEKRHIDILKLVKKAVKVPVIMKLGDNFTNPVALIQQLYANGADGVVLFNRFYPTDINIDKVEQCAGNAFTTEADLSKSLRWTGIASAAVGNISFAVSGGVHNAAGVVKSILAGASAVEVCSAIYLKGNGIIKEMTDGLAEWMDSHTMDNIPMFRGMLNMHDRNEGINTFERTQFLKYYGQFKK